MIAPGVVTTQLWFFPPASSSATEVFGSSDSLPATAQPPEPAPTTTKSNVSVTRITSEVSFFSHHSGRCEAANPEISRFRVRAFHERREMTRPALRHEPQQLLQPCDFSAVGRIEIGQSIERRAIKHRLELAQRPKAPFAVIGAGAGGANAAHRLVDLGEVKQAVVDGDAAGDGAREHIVARGVVLAEPVQRQRPVVLVDIADRLVG